MTDDQEPEAVVPDPPVPGAKGCVVMHNASEWHGKKWPMIVVVYNPETNQYLAAHHLRSDSAEKLLRGALSAVRYSKKLRRK